MHQSSSEQKKTSEYTYIYTSILNKTCGWNEMKILEMMPQM